MWYPLVNIRKTFQGHIHHHGDSWVFLSSKTWPGAGASPTGSREPPNWPSFVWSLSAEPLSAPPSDHKISQGDSSSPAESVLGSTGSGDIWKRWKTWGLWIKTTNYPNSCLKFGSMWTHTHLFLQFTTVFSTTTGYTKHQTSAIPMVQGWSFFFRRSKEMFTLCVAAISIIKSKKRFQTESKMMSCGDLTDQNWIWWLFMVMIIMKLYGFIKLGP